MTKTLLKNMGTKMLRNMLKKKGIKNLRIDPNIKQGEQTVIVRSSPMYDPKKGMVPSPNATVMSRRNYVLSKLEQRRNKLTYMRPDLSNSEKALMNMVPTKGSKKK
tara:strand:- start:6831 stop:7148 length:318 start_codon:yes stop_codon:yes gene_type:complete